MIIAKQTGTGSPGEKVVVISVITKADNKAEELDLLDELRRLTATAGGFVSEQFIQVRDFLETKYLVGKGKLTEIKAYIASQEIALVIVNRELTPAQQRNLQTYLSCRVIDRTALILDIFARHVTTREAALQVELAQYVYQLPRLKNLWRHLEKQEGVIGTRGPGETQLETDRRLIQKRISFLKKKLELVKVHRSTSRKSRAQVPNVAIVGYTNSGKSTLLNSLTRAGVLVEDKLFATLTTTSRRHESAQGQKLIFTDTVGFIRRLPHLLVDAFKSTLEEILYADIIVHTLDITNPRFLDYAHAVYDILRELGVRDIPIITALNKIDILTNKLHLPLARQKFADTVAISARRGENLDGLIEKIHAVLNADDITLALDIPVSRYRFYSQLFGRVKIITETFGATHVHLVIQGRKAVINRIRNKAEKEFGNVCKTE